MLDRSGDTYLYLQISEVLKSRITGGLSPGDLVISEAGIQREFRVARTTARRAIRVLRNQGLVHTRQGEGTFVSSPGEGAEQIPLYRQIADELRASIQAGELPAHRPLPREVTLVRQYGAARETVRRAIALLREQGWVFTIPHRGSYVAPEERRPPS
ncbi:GntR family transcriptional regulator [Nonomuraea angiospora]|uniref:DNA-binding GntR family transcriptional regulator n=1 Tax=Nonomuraea angiospora TaxID=46172 RepID=A0ABR9MFC4_9ACTN|nr:GntR family transcriptional regulator [Nonomuraea angiospora]MBE1591253.1 DNA-binding GntR family transcriptional regulator [Nonomuraea angiospora]